MAARYGEVARDRPHARISRPALLALAVSPLVAADPPPPTPKPENFLLISPGSGHLPATGRLISIEANGLAGGGARRDRRKSGLTIEIKGSLPKDVLLSPSFKDAPTKTILTWLAEKLPIQFRAEPPNTLTVFVEPVKAPPKGDGKS
jgi:hypothetical protein